MGSKFDCCGWATRANLLCSDGRVIRKDAFKHCDGMKVPLVWNHQHNNPEEVLGHALLENRDDGVYAYCTFNNTDSGQTARELVVHGDINQLSIYANKLKQQGLNVIHGFIREVSLVLAGANPGAYIETVLAHSDDDSQEGVIFTGQLLDYVNKDDKLEHADKSEKGDYEVVKKTENTNKEETVQEVVDSMTEKQKTVMYALIGQALEEGKNGTVKHADSDEDDDDENSGETVEDIFNSMSEKQKTVVYALIGQALEDKENNKVDDSEGGEKNMKHNVFEQDANMDNVLTHDEMSAIFETAKRDGKRLSDAVLAHGIEDIDMLFPEATNLNTTPEFIKRDDSWVSKVMGAVHHTPFSRIKSLFADITEIDARAKGYVKGNLKMEEFFTLMKRETTPTTIYKKQQLDRDDIIDITDFDVVAFLKGEMRMMLNEEIARAILFGDGRKASSKDKINEQNVRPIWTDDEVFTVKAPIAVTSNMTEDQKAKAFIRACIKSRKEYKGSGNPVMFMSEDMLTSCLLLEDTNQRIIYDSMDKLKTALRVSDIVPVPVMENLTRVDGANTHELAGLYVNLKDYNVGADKGGAVSMFDDFDIDYNQQKYLIETRISGALTKPYSAVALEFVSATA